MSRPRERLSLIEDSGEYSSRCGYCNSPGSSVSHGMWAYHLTVDASQQLLDRGWRRSGRWLYKPNMDTTCCPPYTIRLDIGKFKPSKNQRKVMRRFASASSGGTVNKSRERSASTVQLERSTSSESSRCAQTCAVSLSTAEHVQPSTSAEAHLDETSTTCLITALTEALQRCVTEGVLPGGTYPSPSLREPSAKLQRKFTRPIQYTSAWPFVVASVAHKSSSGGNWTGTTIAELLAAKLRGNSNVREGGWMVEGVNGHLNFWKETQTSSLMPSRSFELRSREPSLTNLSSDGGTGRQAHSLEIRTVLAGPDLVDVEFPLYRKYQVMHHHDDHEQVTAEQFKRFLVDTPLIHSGPESCAAGDCPPCGFGSFHQQYWLDGKLIAVGVIDVLPSCLSSKYFFWDPDYAHMSLGKVSALQEIEWVKTASQLCSSLRYYYMGFYIHSCPKMKYKADYQPSDLLCPERLYWVPYDQIKHALHERETVILSEVSSNNDSPEDEYNATGIVPQLSAREIPKDVLLSTKLYLGAFGSDPGGVVLCKTLLAAHQITQEFVDTLLEQLAAWHAVVGPVANKLVFIL